MTFRVVRKLDFIENPGWVTSNNIAVDTTAEYNSGTAYVLDDEVKVTGTGGGAESATFKTYKNIQGATGQDPTEDVGTVSPGIGSYWKETGSVNEVALFNDTAQDQSENASSIVIEVEPGSRVNAIGFFNLIADTGNITVNEPTLGEVYNQDIAFADRDVSTWTDWFYADTVQFKNYAVFDIPAYSLATITITLSVSTGNVSLGALVAGTSLDIGDAIEGTSMSFTDYSRANYVPELGRVIFTERDYTEEESVDSVLLKSRLPILKQELLDLRNVVSMWAADTEDFSTLILGFLDDMDITLSGPIAVLANFQIRGVT